jgi:hypothetical protein
MQTNLRLRSNLFAVDRAVKENKSLYKYFPGDYLKLMYPQYADPRSQSMYMDERQINEMEQYLVCYKCKRVCAGTCS